MAATIKIKNSSTASAVPTSSDLVQGELAVNVTDKRLFTENASGTVVELGTNPSILTLPDGSASAPTLTNDGDTNTGVFFPAADTVGISTGGTERARVDSSGNLGLGTTSPSTRLHAKGGSGTTTLRLEPSSSTTIYTQVRGVNGDLYLEADAGNAEGSSAMVFTVDASERMRLDASGQLGIGTSSPKERLDIAGLNGNIRVYGRSGVAANQISSNVYYNGSSWVHDVAKGSSAIILDTDTDNAIKLCVDASTSGFPTERARITSGGYFKAFNTGSAPANNQHEFITSTSNEVTHRIESTAASPYGGYIKFSGANPNNATNYFLNCEDASTRFVARSNGGLANYQANNVNLSDRREKTNFAPAGDYLAKICAIPVQTFNYIDQNLEEDGGLTLGVVAQDVQAVAPELVMESNWAAKDAEPKMRLSIYQTDLQYALMKCIQEQQAIIETLTARIEALEA